MFRRRWVRRALAGVTLGLLLVVAGFFSIRYRNERRGLDRLAAVTAELDATDPGWRQDAAASPPLPDDQNWALLVPKVKAALGGRFAVRRADGRPTPSRPPNRLPDDEDWAALDRALDGNAAAVAIAWSFKDRPRGWRTQPPGNDLITFAPPDIGDTRQVFDVLSAEARRLGRDGHPGAAFELVRAMLNAARSIDGEIVLVDALVRIAGDSLVVGRVEALLAQTRPRGVPVLLQAALAEEAEADFLWKSFRGERALLHRTFEHIRAGKYPYRSGRALAADFKKNPPGQEELARDWRDRPLLPAEHAALLEQATRACEAARLPPHKQRAALAAINVPYPVPARAADARQQLDMLGRVTDARLRGVAQLRCAVVALAAEKFRQATGRWPASLAEIPKEVLPAVPLDPFDGKPLKYARRPDGVTVYSVGPDELDNGGTVGERGNGTEPMTDVCFRLYDPDQRGLPPLPLPPTPEPDEEEPRRSAGPPVGPPPRVLDHDQSP